MQWWSILPGASNRLMCDGVLAASFCVGGEEKEGLCGMASGFEGCELQQQQQQQQQQVNNSALEGKFRDPKLSCANCSSLRCCDMEKELLEHRILETGVEAPRQSTAWPHKERRIRPISDDLLAPILRHAGCASHHVDRPDVEPKQGYAPNKHIVLPFPQCM